MKQHIHEIRVISQNLLPIGDIWLEYRAANKKDMDSIISLWNESRIYHDELDPRLSMIDNAATKVKDYYSEQLESENAIFYLAILENHPIGYVCAQLQKRPPVFDPPYIGFIDGLFVKSDFRRMGVGKKLLDLAIRWLKEKEIDRIQLSVASLNQVGIAFWNQCGFTEVMRRMNMEI